MSKRDHKNDPGNPKARIQAAIRALKRDRELYEHLKQHGHVTINGVRYELLTSDHP